MEDLETSFFEMISQAVAVEPEQKLFGGLVNSGVELTQVFVALLGYMAFLPLAKTQPLCFW